MKKAKFFSKLLILVLATQLVSCSSKKGSGKRSKGKTQQYIRINVESEPQTLDPRKTRLLGDKNLVRTFWEGLLRTDKSGVASAAVADRYTVSNDRKTFTFYLRETKWSNGDPLTAHDFVYSWKKTLSPSFLSDYAFLLYPIKNAKAVKQGDLPVSLLGVQAKDDYTLVVNLEFPAPYFFELVTDPVFFPINQKVDKAKQDWSRNKELYVSNGPYLLTEWKHNDIITAEKNPSYWDAQTVKLEKIDMVMVDSDTSFLMFENKELDWQGSPYSTIPTAALESLKSSNQIAINPFLGTYWIRTNTALHPLHSEEIRKALALAINRQEIVDHVTCGEQTPATGIVPASMGLASAPYFADGDADQARKIFLAALEHEKIKPEKFPELSLTYVSTSRNHKIAQAVQDQWRSSLGIKVKLEPLDRKIYIDRISKGDYQLSCGDWIADMRDPISFLEIFKEKHIGGNNTNWESLNYQKALEASYVATTESDRMELLQKSEQIIMDEMPVIPIFHHSMLHLQNDRLKDVVLTDAGVLDFKWAYVVE